MIELLHDLSDWLLDFADSEWAVFMLAAISFGEAIILPFPPDPFLIAVALLQPENALWLAGIVTVTSVAGGLVDHWVGVRFGRPVIERIAPRDKVEAAERLFAKYGWWTVLLAAFTPLPYKVFSVTAGILRFDRKGFLVACLVGRGVRFFLQGALIFVYGESIREFLEGNFELVTIATGALVVAAALGIILYARLRRRNAPVGEEGP